MAEKPTDRWDREVRFWGDVMPGQGETEAVIGFCKEAGVDVTTFDSYPSLRRRGRTLGLRVG